MPQQPPIVAKATLTALPGGTPLTVHFNPASLVYSVENSVAQQSGNPKKAQYVAQFSGKLTMDLQFDTTDDGSDVRTVTNQVALFMQASANASAAAQNAAPPSANGNSSGPPPKAPPVLMFQWGTYQFQGIMDSFKETIDFFSNDGVALRALVSIGLSRQDQVFDEGANLSGPTDAGSLVPSSSGDSAQSMATRGGDPSAARQLGADNGLESLRFTGGASMQVSGGGVQLNPPTAFVTASSASAGAGVGLRNLGRCIGRRLGRNLHRRLCGNLGRSVVRRVGQRFRQCPDLRAWPCLWSLCFGRSLSNSGRFFRPADRPRADQHDRKSESAADAACNLGRGCGGLQRRQLQSRRRGKQYRLLRAFNRRRNQLQLQRPFDLQQRRLRNARP